MEIITKKIGEIIPYKNNPRKNDDAVEYVANSMKEFGFKVPVIIDKNNIIVAGHTRVKAAERLGIEEIPCIMADDLTDEQIKAFRLADNKVGEIAEWDFDLLDIELADIDLDMSEFGFDDDKNIEIFNQFDNEEIMSWSNNERDTFNVTFTFPKEKETQVLGYIRERGKEEIVMNIINYMEGLK